MGTIRLKVVQNKIQSSARARIINEHKLNKLVEKSKDDPLVKSALKDLVKAGDEYNKVADSTPEDCTPDQFAEHNEAWNKLFAAERKLIQIVKLKEGEDALPLPMQQKCQRSRDGQS